MKTPINSKTDRGKRILQIALIGIPVIMIVLWYYLYVWKDYHRTDLFYLVETSSQNKICVRVEYPLRLSLDDESAGDKNRIILGIDSAFQSQCATSASVALALRTDSRAWLRDTAGKYLGTATEINLEKATPVEVFLDQISVPSNLRSILFGSPISLAVSSLPEPGATFVSAISMNTEPDLARWLRHLTVWVNSNLLSTVLAAILLGVATWIATQVYSARSAAMEMIEASEKDTTDSFKRFHANPLHELSRLILGVGARHALEGYEARQRDIANIQYA